MAWPDDQPVERGRRPPRGRPPLPGRRTAPGQGPVVVVREVTERKLEEGVGQGLDAQRDAKQRERYLELPESTVSIGGSRTRYMWLTYCDPLIRPTTSADSRGSDERRRALRPASVRYQAIRRLKGCHCGNRSEAGGPSARRPIEPSARPRAGRGERPGSFTVPLAVAPGMPTFPSLSTSDRLDALTPRTVTSRSSSTRTRTTR